MVIVGEGSDATGEGSSSTGGKVSCRGTNDGVGGSW